MLLTLTRHKKGRGPWKEKMGNPERNTAHLVTVAGPKTERVYPSLFTNHCNSIHCTALAQLVAN